MHCYNKSLNKNPDHIPAKNLTRDGPSWNWTRYWNVKLQYEISSNLKNFREFVEIHVDGVWDSRPKPGPGPNRQDQIKFENLGQKRFRTKKKNWKSRTNSVGLVPWPGRPWILGWSFEILTDVFNFGFGEKREWGNRNGDLTGFLIGNGIQIDEILMSSARSVRDYWRSYID